MKRLIKTALLFLCILIASPGCYTSKKNRSELGGLMLLENEQLARNKTYYSMHNRKAKKKVRGNYKKVTAFRHKKRF